MRLLQVGPAGELSLVERVGNSIPPYTILSHTWGEDEDEVTYRDMVDGKAKNRPGYIKLDFCQKWTTRDSLEFFWVDTCCIDKSSSAELSEAINSMFQWYQNAARCYVYLTDVRLTPMVKAHAVNTERAFRDSKWFTRGWTLQELIGPKDVIFFSEEGLELGDKMSRVIMISEITGVPVEVLRGSRAPADFSIDERMSWAHCRTTKREEDAAYSLLGIFGVYLPLIYGEGRQRAFRRLRKEMHDSMEHESPTFRQLPSKSISKVAPGPELNIIPNQSLRLFATQTLDISRKGNAVGIILLSVAVFFVLSSATKILFVWQTFDRFIVSEAWQSDQSFTQNSKPTVTTSPRSDAKSALAHLGDDEMTGFSSVTTMISWPGQINRSNFSGSYRRQRDMLSSAAYEGKWVEVFQLLLMGSADHNENWANAVRLKNPGDKLNFWTPLHQAVFLNAPASVIQHLVWEGSLRTIRTLQSPFACQDLTAAEIAREMGYDHLTDILAPVIYHPVPDRILSQLQDAFHGMIKAEIGDLPNLLLPDLVALTELRVPEMWFPLFRVERDFQGLLGYHYRLDKRQLVVTRLGIGPGFPSEHRIE